MQCKKCGQNTMMVQYRALPMTKNASLIYQSMACDAQCPQGEHLHYGCLCGFTEIGSCKDKDLCSYPIAGSPVDAEAAAKRAFARCCCEEHRAELSEIRADQLNDALTRMSTQADRDNRMIALLLDALDGTPRPWKFKCGGTLGAVWPRIEDPGWFSAIKTGGLRRDDFKTMRSAFEWFL